MAGDTHQHQNTCEANGSIENLIRGVNPTVEPIPPIWAGRRGRHTPPRWVQRQRRPYIFEMISITVCDRPSQAHALMLSQTDKLSPVTLMALGTNQRRTSASGG